MDRMARKNIFDAWNRVTFEKSKFNEILDFLKSVMPKGGDDQRAIGRIFAIIMAYSNVLSDVNKVAIEAL